MQGTGVYVSSRCVSQQCCFLHYRRTIPFLLPLAPAQGLLLLFEHHIRLLFIRSEHWCSS